MNELSFIIVSCVRLHPASIGLQDTKINIQKITNVQI